MRVFWSWQSDRGRRPCRDLITGALEAAIRLSTQSLSLQTSERPELDQDTQGEAGLAEIATTILRKIDSAAVFVADVTPVGRTDGGKLTPNPNVLIELGYALKSLGSERIILVANKQWGGSPEELPFDLRHRRGPIYYKLSRDASVEEFEQTKLELADKLASPIAMSLRFARAAAAPSVEPIAHSVRDTAVWHGIEDGLRHRDWFGSATTHEVQLVGGNASYARVTPSAWPEGIPIRDRVSLSFREARVQPLGADGTFDGGVNEFGVLQIRVREKRDSFTLADGLSQWIAKSGELWGTDYRISDELHGRRVMFWLRIIKGWSKFIHASVSQLTALDARPPFRIAVGVNDLLNTHWAAANREDQVAALEAEFSHIDMIDSASCEELEQYLLRATNRFRDSFGLASISRAELLSLLS